MKQVKFYDGCCNSIASGGIMLDNGDIICGCCGGIITSKMQKENPDFKLLKVYDYWVDFSEEILGDDN